MSILNSKFQLIKSLLLMHYLSRIKHQITSSNKVNEDKFKKIIMHILILEKEEKYLSKIDTKKIRGVSAKSQEHQPTFKMIKI